MDAVIGIDIGTYSSKGVVCRADGAVLAEARMEHGVSIPKAGQLEHDADEVWWHDFVSVSRRLMASIPEDTKIAAVGLSAIGPCLLPVDEVGRPLRPAILYGADVRASEQAARLEREHAAGITRLSGARLTSQAVGPKILWLRENEPDVFARAARFMTSTGYVVFRLTGAYGIDHHNASYFAPFYDIRKMRWDVRFADGDVRIETLPDLCWTNDVVGFVTADAASQTGIPAGTPVTGGTTDGAAEAVGAGVLQPGDLMISYGSTSALVIVADQYRPVPGLWMTRGAGPDEFVLTAALSTSGSITSWFREQFARELPQNSFSDTSEAYAELCREAEASPPGARGLLLLPYFSGERSPFNDPLARGVISGLSLSHDRGDLYRAILEATAFGIRHNLERMEECGTTPRRTIAVGGGTASRLWLQIVSDVTGLSQEIPDRLMGAAYGDAYLAATAVGLRDRHAKGCQPWVQTIDRIEPDRRNRDLYARRYKLYRGLFKATRPIVHELAREESENGCSRTYEDAPERPTANEGLRQPTREH
jgi:xylulokinase